MFGQKKLTHKLCNNDEKVTPWVNSVYPLTMYMIKHYQSQAAGENLDQLGIHVSVFGSGTPLPLYMLPLVYHPVHIKERINKFKKSNSVNCSDCEHRPSCTCTKRHASASCKERVNHLGKNEIWKKWEDRERDTSNKPKNNLHTSIY